MNNFNRTIIKAAGLTGLVTVICILPTVAGAYQIEILIFLFLNIIIAVAYRLILLAGEWSFCHIVIMGVGAYGSALVIKSFDVSPWLGMLTGPLAAGAAAYLLSFPLFRMKGFYFIVGSFVAGEAIRLCWLKYRGIFGGSNGIVGVPSLEFAGVDLAMPVPFYFFALAILLLSLAAMHRLEKSRLGLTLRAIATHDKLAASVGVHAWRYRTTAFVLAGVFTGLAGAMQAQYLSVVSPNNYGLTPMLEVMVWVIVGGTGNFAGPIVGTTVLTFMAESLRGFEEYRAGVYGLLLILTMTFMRKGLSSAPVLVMEAVRRSLSRRARPL